MESKPTSAYFDMPCDSYKQFQQIKAELERQGFIDRGNASVSELDYPPLEFGEEVVEDTRILQARQEHSFRNEVDEKTWDLKDRGYEIVRTQGFDIHGKLIDDLVTFFRKEPAE